MRGLAFVVELVNGDSPSWEDIVKFSFAYDGKGCVPFPLDRKVMDYSIEILRQTEEETRISQKEKLDSLQRLRRFIPADRNS